ncbi:efflux RND transporter periplasmic adaptor subunit [Glaciecola sp. 2405UD65-10]|uniref:efflux RND transporter periplasmic adaptor subunit n=1 Tax=Glaciecola sp. 2405UD65-10 TaxID=3397244 RepID=UPI003B5B76B7
MPFLNHKPAIAMAAIVCLLLSGCAEQSESAPSRPAPEVDVSLPIKAKVTLWDEYTGRFGAVEQVEIRARVSGYLEKTNFKDGQVVSKGDVLFEIDQRPFKIALDAAKSRLNLAKKEYERGINLRKQNSISQEEVDQRNNDYQLALTALEEAKLNLEFTLVKSPIDGVVSRDFVNVGNLVTGGAAGATLLTNVVSVHPIHFYFDAGERDLLKYLRLSQTDKRQSSRTHPNRVQVRLQDEKEFSHLGVMDFVDNQIDESTGTIQGRAIFDNQDGFILPGIFGRIRLIDQDNVSALLIPDTAIGTDQSKKFIYTVDANNKVAKKFITLGRLYTNDLRIVESGLDAGDKLIVNGIMRARPGSEVNVNEVDLSSQFTY